MPLGLRVLHLKTRGVKPEILSPLKDGRFGNG